MVLEDEKVFKIILLLFKDLWGERERRENENE